MNFYVEGPVLIIKYLFRYHLLINLGFSATLSWTLLIHWQVKFDIAAVLIITGFYYYLIDSISSFHCM